MSQEFFKSPEKSPEEALEVLKAKLKNHKEHLIERIYEKWKDEVQAHDIYPSHYEKTIKDLQGFKESFDKMTDKENKKILGYTEFGWKRGDQDFGLAPYQKVIAVLPEEIFIFKRDKIVDFGPLMKKYDKFRELEEILIDENTGLEEKEESGLQFIQDPENRKIFFENSNGNPDNIFGDLFREIKKFFRLIRGVKTSNETFIEEAENLLTLST